jgi:hypothetical protein
LNKFSQNTNTNSNINTNLNQIPGNSISALDALNQQLASEPKNPPANAKQTTQPKNIKNNNVKNVNKNANNTKKVVKKVIKKTKINSVPNNKNKNNKIIEPDISDELDDLDEQIRKLEMEIINNKKNKQENPEIKVEINKNTNIDNENTEESTIIEKDITESKKALIKLLLEAKKTKNLSEENFTPLIEDSSTVINYEENFNVDGIEENQNNEADVMKIDFNDPESAKLIKVIDDEDMNYTVPLNVKIRSTNPNNSFAISRNNVNNFVKGSIYFDIDSENITSYDCYNDYMVNLDKKMKFTDINIKSIDLPINNSENINKSNNELKIVINNKEQIFELEENYYNRYEIKEFLNEAFNAYDFDISCDIQDGIFIFHSESKFTMLSHETSILSTLGFNKNAYVNKNIYTAENPHQIGDNVYYMVIENISSEPLFYINKDTDEIKKLFDFEPFETDNLIIQFNKSKKDLIKNSKEYNYFFSDKHLITFELVS